MVVLIIAICAGQNRDMWYQRWAMLSRLEALVEGGNMEEMAGRIHKLAEKVDKGFSSCGSLFRFVGFYQYDNDRLLDPSPFSNVTKLFLYTFFYNTKPSVKQNSFQKWPKTSILWVKKAGLTTLGGL